MASTTARGYGNRHQKLRKQLAPLVASGQERCARCSAPILPGEPWDLGHDDRDRSRYTGPEHSRCKRASRPAPPHLPAYVRQPHWRRREPAPRLVEAVVMSRQGPRGSRSRAAGNAAPRFAQAVGALQHLLTGVPQVGVEGCATWRKRTSVYRVPRQPYKRLPVVSPDAGSRGRPLCQRWQAMSIAPGCWWCRMIGGSILAGRLARNSPCFPSTRRMASRPPRLQPSRGNESSRKVRNA